MYVSHPICLNLIILFDSMAFCFLSSSSSVASPLKGVTSYGMVLAASAVNEKGEKTNVELVTPPAGAKPGDRVILEGEDWSAYPPIAEVDVKKKVNAWLSVKDKLKIDGEGKATFDGKRFVTQGTKQYCTSSFKDAIIS